MVPDSAGGGWCYTEGLHAHPYPPEHPDRYLVEDNVYYWSAPVSIPYFGGHPLPGGAWCMIRGRHLHDFVPPDDGSWHFTPGRGYSYHGPYSQYRPPPLRYWPRPAPAPFHVGGVRPAPAR
jgi:hypothetical protein